MGKGRKGKKEKEKNACQLKPHCCASMHMGCLLLGAHQCLLSSEVISPGVNLSKIFSLSGESSTR